MTIGGKIGMPKKTCNGMFGLHYPNGKSEKANRRCVCFYAAGSKAAAFLFFLVVLFFAFVFAGGGGVCT
jgi:hypothetical protein